MQTSILEEDAWILGSYRRLDALEVPMFRDYRSAASLEPLRCARSAHLLPLAEDLPRAVLPFRDFLRGQSMPDPLPFDRQLALVLKYLAAPLRYEPQNLYLVHTAVPSARSLYPCQVMVVVRPADSCEPARLYAYRPDHEALEDLGPRAGFATLLGEGQVALAGIGRSWMLAEKYGEFAPYALTLEAGHLEAQLQHLARLVGWRVTQSGLHGDAWDAALACGELEATCFGVVVNAPPVPLGMPERRARRVAVRQPSAGLSQRFPQLPRLVELFRADGAAARPARRPEPATAGEERLYDGELDVLEVLRRRTSGNDSGGFAPISPALDRPFLETLLGSTRALRRARTATPAEDALALRVGWLNPTGYPIGLYTDELVPVPLGLGPREFVQGLQAALPVPGFRYNMSAFALSLIIAADPAATSARLGGGTIGPLHVAAGAVAQDFCLAAAAQGLFARPVRMFREQVLEGRWRLPGHLVYQVLAGFNRTCNLAMELS